jgi:hypothetical protein
MDVAPDGSVLFLADHYDRQISYDDDGFLEESVTYDPRIVRLTPGGQFDTTFSGDGEVTLPNFYSELNSFGVGFLADGKIIAVTRQEALGNNENAIAFHLLADGSFDPDFSSGGVVLAEVSALYGESSFAMARDGTITLFGLSNPASRSVARAIITRRFDLAGNPVASWGCGADNQRRSFPPPAGVTADGKLLLSRIRTTPSRSSASIQRWNGIRRRGIRLGHAVRRRHARYRRHVARRRHPHRLVMTA